MSKHLVITVHGIRTYGQWPTRLNALLRQVESTVETTNYAYGYFSFIAFLVPPFRWLATKRFQQILVEEVKRDSWDRVDLVGHSFGTHLLGWALQSLSSDPDLKIHTVILAGSVLRPRFRWDRLIPARVGRLINECGVRDGALIASQLFVLLTGMAGRVGFSGPLSRRFQNCYFNFGHSGYFDGDNFMRSYWVPLLTTEADIVPVDERPPLTILLGVADTLLNNAAPIKLSMYFGILAAIILWITGLLLEFEASRAHLVTEVARANSLLGIAREQLAASLVAVGRSKLEERPHEAVRYAAVAAKLTQALTPADLLADAIARYPEYNLIIPAGSDLNTRTIDTGPRTETDAFATDPAGLMVLARKAVTVDSADGGDASRGILVLRSTETGGEISSRTLAANEKFIAPEPSSTRLLITREGPLSDFHVRVFDLETKLLDSPALEVDHVTALATTGGSWPIFVLRANGRVLQYDSPTASPIESTGQWPQARALSVHPELGVVAVLNPDSVIVLSPSSLTESNRYSVGSAAPYDMLWGPRADTFLIAQDSTDGTNSLRSLTAFYGASGTSQQVWKWSSDYLDLRVKIVRSRKGSRFLVPDEELKSNVAVARVVDLTWPESNKDDAKVTVRVHTLSGNVPQTRLLEIHSMALSEDGEIAVVSASVTLLSGLNFDRSQTEIWDLISLDWNTDLQPQALLLKSGDSVIQRSALAGSTLLLWDTSEIVHVFKLDQDFQRRILHASITMTSPRYVQVDFGKSGRRVYDLETGKW